MTEPIARPVYRDAPDSMRQAADRSAEHAIYTHKNVLYAEHRARTGHDPLVAVECEVCALIVAGTSSDPRR